MHNQARSLTVPHCTQAAKRWLPVLGIISSGVDARGKDVSPACSAYTGAESDGNSTPCAAGSCASVAWPRSPPYHATHHCRQCDRVSRARRRGQGTPRSRLRSRQGAADAHQINPVIATLCVLTSKSILTSSSLVLGRSLDWMNSAALAVSATSSFLGLYQVVVLVWTL